MLASLTVVIIQLHICLSNHHVEHLKYTHFLLPKSVNNQTQENWKVPGGASIVGGQMTLCDLFCLTQFKSDLPWLSLQEANPHLVMC